MPVELFGQTPFRPIGDEPYALTLGPHAFYWFALQPEQDTLAASREAGAPVLEVDDSWEELLGAATGALEVILPAHLQTSPWFAGMGRRVLAVRILEVVAVPHETTQSYATFLRVDYADGEPETYSSPSPLPPMISLRTGTVRRTRSSLKCDGQKSWRLRSARRRNADLRSSYGTPERHCRWRQPPEGCRWRNRGNAHPRIQPDRRPSADGAAASHRRGRAEPHVGRLQRAASPEALPSARGGDPP